MIKEVLIILANERVRISFWKVVKIIPIVDAEIIIIILSYLSSDNPYFKGNKICDMVWENRAYVHKIHCFTLFYLSHLLCELYTFCKLHWIAHGLLYHYQKFHWYVVFNHKVMKLQSLKKRSNFVCTQALFSHVGSHIFLWKCKHFSPLSSD